jgi:hypothetical protein
MPNMCSLPDPPEALSAHPVDIGQRTEAIVLAALVRRGYRVLTPFGTNSDTTSPLTSATGFYVLNARQGAFVAARSSSR